MPTDEERQAAACQEYTELVHAMQSGIMAEMDAQLNTAHTPKQLRVGVNSAMVETSVLVQLLIERGLITNAEWAERLRDGMRAEVERYEQRLTKYYGRPVHLA